ncbi:MAG: binding-protein-dependent transporters inner membrane component [Promethearchaeota archaeon CR_4]|nr:MAG: binding-protein-dependent transporters inner membrane component [Candidatus Lokiarchaeota archaeon CR_4]
MANKQKNMVKYVIKRLLMMIPMLILVLIFTWFLSRLMAVNPVTNRLAGSAGDPEAYRAELERIGYFDPWYVQLGTYLYNLFRGDWGNTYVIFTGTPIIDIVADVFPRTIELMLIPIILSPILAVKLGIASATHRDKKKDAIIRFVAILGAGFPVFWIASMVQTIFGYALPLFTMGSLDIPAFFANSSSITSIIPIDAPTTGFRIIDCIIYNDQRYLWDTLLHLILPAMCITFVSLASITRQTRSSMLDVLDQDYIRTARAKGVMEKDVINKHALRNALLPVSNLIIGGTATALLGSFFVEVTFNYYGYGYYMVKAILLGDYLLINGLLVVATIIILTGNLVADVMYVIIDPRISYK